MMAKQLRLSELEQDVRLKRQTFLASKDKLVALLKEKSKPINLLSNHSTLIIGTLIGLFSTFKIFKGVGRFFGKGASTKPPQKNMVRRVAQLAGLFFLEKMMPAVVSIAWSLVKQLIKARK